MLAQLRLGLFQFVSILSGFGRALRGRFADGSFQVLLQSSFDMQVQLGGSQLSSVFVGVGLPSGGLFTKLVFQVALQAPGDVPGQITPQNSGVGVLGPWYPVALPLHSAASAEPTCPPRRFPTYASVLLMGREPVST